MAKLALVVLALATILAFVEVSGYTTTTTTTIEDNGRCRAGMFRSYCYMDGLDNPRGCQIPIQQLNHCQMHLTSFDYKLRMAVENPQQQHLGLCCNQLQQVQEQCQCEAIKEVLEQAFSYTQGAQGQMMERMVQKAQMLPNQCNLRCSI
uniref:Preproalbumin PawS1 n=1 Tax=Heliopsis helianthoides var. scabra TaxID=192637 RepID=A0A023GYH3_9ASTR|nr:preproalbumin PawS1 [Heliopsis helianthoides var. scabra]